MKYDAIVTAGGWGTRMGCEPPKSLLEVDGIPLLRKTLDSLIRAGRRKILVLSDRPDYWTATDEIIQSVGGFVTLASSRSGCATLGLVQEIIELVDERFFFLYGHAPRPIDHLMKMMEMSDPIVATSTNTTSKSKKILAQSAGFLEPPYLVSRPNVLALRTQEWGDLFDVARQKTAELPLCGPSEFNYPHEFSEYRDYVRTI